MLPTPSPTPDLRTDPSGYIDWLSQRSVELCGLDLSELVSAVETGVLDRSQGGAGAAFALIAEHV